MLISNLIEIDEVEIVLSCNNIVPPILFSEIEYEPSKNVANTFVFKYDEKIKVSDININDFKFGDVKNLRGDEKDEVSTILMGLEGEVWLAHDGRYFGLTNSNGIFNIIVLEDIELGYVGSKKRLTLKFRDTTSTTFYKQKPVLVPTLIFNDSVTTVEEKESPKEESRSEDIPKSESLPTHPKVLSEGEINRILRGFNCEDVDKEYMEIAESLLNNKEL